MDLENEDHDVATVIGMIIGNVIISLIMGYWYQYLVNTYATHFKGEEIDLHFAIFFAFAFLTPGKVRPLTFLSALVASVGLFLL